MDKTPHLDEEALAELRDVMEDEFTLLIKTYVGDSLERISGLKTALKAGDEGAFTRMAHSLKGSCINIGAPYLGELCQAAEAAGKAQRLDLASALLKNIEFEFQVVSDQLKTLLR